MSLEVTDNSTIRKLRCGFPFTFRSNYGPSYIISEIKPDIGRKSRFLPRGAMHSRDCAVAKCPSVYLSITRRYCVKTAKHDFKLFPPSASHTILVFPYQTLWQYADEDPVTGRPMHVVWKIVIFTQYLVLSRQGAQLSHKDHATFRVIEYFSKSFKITQGHSKWNCWVGACVPISILLKLCISYSF